MVPALLSCIHDDSLGTVYPVSHRRGSGSLRCPYSSA